jgi:hypothetical protein
MEERRTRYPGFNVLSQVKEWDPHTRDIVLKRLGPFPELKYLTPEETQMLKTIASHIVYDNREAILNYVIHHLDQTLSSDIGESERKPKTPPAKDLIRQGLSALNKAAQKMAQKPFTWLDTASQFKIIASLQTETVEPIPEWKRIPPKGLFKKLAGMIISAYYSHPTIWSEIGYGGPAYPRGYVRIEPGLTDPWEAKHHE